MNIVTKQDEYLKNFLAEIEFALDNEFYMVALFATIAIPDIFGNIEYPELSGDKHTKKRYTQWVKEYLLPIAKANVPKGLNQNRAYPFNVIYDENILYKLRCCLLHEGIPEINPHDFINSFKKESEFSQGIMMDNCEFRLILEPPPWGENFESSIDFKNYYNFKIDISVPLLCDTICWAAKNYITTNREKIIKTAQTAIPNKRVLFPTIIDNRTYGFRQQLLSSQNERR